MHRVGYPCPTLLATRTPADTRPKSRGSTSPEEDHMRQQSGRFAKRLRPRAGSVERLTTSRSAGFAVDAVLESRRLALRTPCVRAFALHSMDARQAYSVCHRGAVESPARAFMMCAAHSIAPSWLRDDCTVRSNRGRAHGQDLAMCADQVHPLSILPAAVARIDPRDSAPQVQACRSVDAFELLGSACATRAEHGS